MSDNVISFPDQFNDGLQQLHLSLNIVQNEQLLRFCQELLDWNTRVNLTAIREPGEVFIKHFLDSLSLLSVYDPPEARLLDIGSGAGFPCLVLKIARPQWQITSMDSTGKKIAFQNHIIEILRLDGIMTIHNRAEELAHNEAYRAAFDAVTARAVSALPNLLEYCTPYCRVGGVTILPKKGELEQEMVQGKRAAKLVHAALIADMPVTLSGLDDGRRLLVWRQEALCPPRFPRSGAAMAKKPLG